MTRMQALWFCDFCGGETSTGRNAAETVRIAGERGPILAGFIGSNKTAAASGEDLMRALSFRASATGARQGRENRLGIAAVSDDSQFIHS